MKLFARIKEILLNALLLGSGPQEPLQGLPALNNADAAGKGLKPGLDVDSSTAPCIHGPKNRTCWSPGFDINTDYDLRWPDTGVTRQVRRRHSTISSVAESL